MKKYLKNIYYHQPQKIVTIVVFLFLIIFSILPLAVNQNSISGIVPFFNQYGTIISWGTSILIVIVPLLVKFILKTISRLPNAKNASAINDGPEKPCNREFAGIIKKKDLEQILSVTELLKEKNVRISNQQYQLTQETLSWLQEQCKTRPEITAFDFLRQQGIIHLRDFSGFIKTVEKAFSPDSSKEIILTGKSGCGKSLFVGMFKMCPHDTYDISIYNNSYAVENDVLNYIHEAIEHTPPLKKKILIFDQFEDALSNEVLSSNRLAEELVKTGASNAILVYVLREDKVAGLFSKRSDVAIPVYSLSIQNEEIEQLKLKCCRFLSLGNYELDRILAGNSSCVNEEAQIIIPLLDGVITETIPLVAFELVCSIVENGSLTSTGSKQRLSALELSSSPEKVMYYYFDEWVNQFDDPKTGLAILYFLSDYSAHRVDDIQNISFCENIPERQMTKFGLINALPRTPQSYEFAHDYLADVARHYCRNFKSFSETVADNIDFYREEIATTEAHIQSKVRKRIENYCSKVNRNIVNIFLYILLIGAGIACIRHALPLFTSPNPWEVLSLTAILINCLFSTLYVYSFCVDFLIIYGGLAVLPLAAYGALSIILAIANQQIWAISLSIESFILVGTIFIPSRNKIQKKASRSFSKTVGIMTAFSISTAFLGVVYYHFVNGFQVQIAGDTQNISLENFSFIFRGALELSYYGLYFAVIISSLILHCLTSYFFERIGLANRLIEKRTP